jgi:acyl carrier protein
MTTTHPLDTQIRVVLRDHGRLNKPVEQIDSDADLYQAGMTSHASVNVMLALESAFGVEFPDHMLKRSVFNSVASIHSALAELEQARTMR